MYARIVLAVASGRKLIKSPASAVASDDVDRSGKLYISFETISVSPPTERANNEVSSNIGSRISRKLYDSKTSRADCSNQFHKVESGGRMSRVPLIARNCFCSVTK